MHFSTSQDWVPTVHSQTVHYLWLPARVARRAKRKDTLTTIHSTVRSGLGCQDPHHHLKHGRSGKKTQVPPDHLLLYQIRKVSKYNTFILWLSQWYITRSRPHMLLCKPFLNGSHSNSGHPLKQLSPTNLTFLTFLATQSEHISQLPSSNLGGK